MPNYDKTGPNSDGPKTGRGKGNCDEQKNKTALPRRGKANGGRGNGQGRGNK